MCYVLHTYLKLVAKGAPTLQGIVEQQNTCALLGGMEGH